MPVSAFRPMLPMRLAPLAALLLFVACSSAPLGGLSTTDLAAPSLDLRALADLAADLRAPDTSACTNACDARERASMNQGWCFMSEKDGFTECGKYCAPRWAGWPDAQRGKFLGCARDNPLCFESIEMCMDKP